MSSTDFEVRKDLRESIDRVWAEARRLGILSIDTPVRQQLRTKSATRARVAPRRRRRNQG